MLATRVSFMNAIARLCERTGADVDSVRLGVGSDRRIGPTYLFSGVGYGGSCFPKDMKALARTMRELELDSSILDAVEGVNETQKRLLLELVVERFGEDLSGRTLRSVGARLQAQYGRHAGGAKSRDDRRASAAGARGWWPTTRWRCRRPGASSVTPSNTATTLRCAGWGRRSPHPHRMASLPPSGLRPHAFPAPRAGDHGRAEPLCAACRGALGFEYHSVGRRRVAPHVASCAS